MVVVVSVVKIVTYSFRQRSGTVLVDLLIVFHEKIF